MGNHKSGFKELRPIGEASHIPDAKLTKGCDTDPERQRVATTTGGYPDEPSDPDVECQSCGASIPADQSKCQFCLEHKLDATSEPNPTNTGWALSGVIQFLVESKTFYGAVAKGAAAATLLTATHDEPVDDCTLIYGLDDKPAPQLAERWPSLPAAVEVTSTAGEELLTAACERTAWREDVARDPPQKEISLVYDERGQRIRELSSLKPILDGGDQMWIVPAIAVETVTNETDSPSVQSKITTVTALECQHCTRETDHRFRTHESFPDEMWTDQPIWECQVCGTDRYGPDPE